MKKKSIPFHVLIVGAIYLVLFAIPFFWLNPGEMDLGGDSSRLYFYDPVNYMFNQSLFSVSQSSFGGDNFSYFGIPFFLVLLAFKSLLNSPTMLISAFHGFSLSTSFLSCYFIVKILLKDYADPFGNKQYLVELSGILAGLFYTLSPVSVHWWTFPILTFNQVFISPLMFLLLLQLCITHKMKYLASALLVSLLFAPNFSYIGAPTFFAFYPLAFIFLIVYTRAIRRKTLPIKKLFLGALLFFIIHSFHLVPQIRDLVSRDSMAFFTVFDQFGRVARGLEYFKSTSSAYKISPNLLVQLQMTDPGVYSWMFILLPLILLAGFYWNKKKTYLITGVLFLIALFFATANITNVGINLYALAFLIPGFAMFRNFYGQWMWAFLFFYSLLLGQALFIVLSRVSKVYRYLLVGSIALLFVTTAWPFINGSLTDTTFWQSKNVRSHVVMDAAYEEVLSYIRSLPVDGKILSLPLDDHGYQIVKGANDAAYAGPSTITYLTNKKEFKGADEFGQFGQTFLNAARNKDYRAIQDLLSIFNVKYIFLNTDPYVFGENFPSFPYANVLKYLPATQQEYQEFVEQLDVTLIHSFANKYHIYEVNPSSYLPHVYVPDSVIYWNNKSNIHVPFSLYRQYQIPAIYDDYETIKGRNHVDMLDAVVFEAHDNNEFDDFFDQRRDSKYPYAFVSRKLTFPAYSLVVLREKYILRQIEETDLYYDRSMFYANKRIRELEKFGDTIPLLNNVTSIADLDVQWNEPAWSEFARHPEYHSWEISLVRYKRIIENLIERIFSTTDSDYSKTVNKVDLKRNLLRDQESIKSIIKETEILSFSEKRYLILLSNSMFEDIFNTLNLDIQDPNRQYFSALNVDTGGSYGLYIKREDIGYIPLSNISVAVNGNRLLPQDSEHDGWVSFGNIDTGSGDKIDLTLNITDNPNLVEDNPWLVSDKYHVEQNMTSFEVDPYLPNKGGVIREISTWDSESMYFVQFDYQTNNKRFDVVINEKISDEDGYSSVIYQDKLRAESWKAYTGIMKSSKDGVGALLQFISVPDDIYEIEEHEDREKKIEVRNISIIKIPDPLIVLKKDIDHVDSSIPRIAFTKVNSTKYKVSVRGAKGPYNLILLDNFSTKWKVFQVDETHEAKTMTGRILRFVGTVGMHSIRALDLSISQSSQSVETTSNFDGTFAEGMHTNMFLDQNSFETFGYEPIAQEDHMTVNGYANSWYITPDDVGYQEDYELVVEKTSQKLFYVSLFISVIGVLGVAILLVKSLIKNT